jgi:hypothetical protein
VICICISLGVLNSYYPYNFIAVYAYVRILSLVKVCFFVDFNTFRAYAGILFNECQISSLSSVFWNVFFSANQESFLNCINQ